MKRFTLSAAHGVAAFVALILLFSWAGRIDPLNVINAVLVGCVCGSMRWHSGRG